MLNRKCTETRPFLLTPQQNKILFWCQFNIKIKTARLQCQQCMELKQTHLIFSIDSKGQYQTKLTDHKNVHIVAISGSNYNSSICIKKPTHKSGIMLNVGLYSLIFVLPC